jgi:DNA-binding HxlR family transcriptional regulator
MSMTRRNYSQFCGLAHALDIVGERWTLLIVRELGSGPKRYTNLADALPGIGTSLLATRVRQLEADGVIRRRLLLDQPASAVAYELTEAGRELATAVIPLALWGARHQLAEADAGAEVFRAEWALGFLAGSGAGAVPSELEALYEFHIGDSVACLRIRDGRMSVSPGPAVTTADVVVRASASVLGSIAGQRTTMAEAVRAGLVEATGDPAAIGALIGIVEGSLSVFGPA